MALLHTCLNVVTCELSGDVLTVKNMEVKPITDLPKVVSNHGRIMGGFRAVVVSAVDIWLGVLSSNVVPPFSVKRP